MLGYTTFKRNGPWVEQRTREIEEAKERTRRRDEARRREILGRERGCENNSPEDLTQDG